MHDVIAYTWSRIECYVHNIECLLAFSLSVEAILTFIVFDGAFFGFNLLVYTCPTIRTFEIVIVSIFFVSDLGQSVLALFDVCFVLIVLHRKFFFLCEIKLLLHFFSDRCKGLTHH